MGPSRARQMLHAASAVGASAFLVALLTCASCGRRPDRSAAYPRVSEAVAGDRTLRVLLSETRTPVLLSAERGAVLSYPGRADAPLRLPPFSKVGVSPVSGGILIGQTEYAADRVRLEPEPDALLNIEGNDYRGALLLVRRADGWLLVLNEIDIEQYLPGVVGAELPARWPEQALRAAEFERL